MRTLVCFSGGYDSTALLLSELQAGHTVDTCYFQLDNNFIAQGIELKNRKKILKHVAKITQDKSFDGALGHDYIYDLYKKFPSAPFIYLIQAYVWIQYLILGVDLSKYDRIVFGYVKYDDFWHYKTEIINIYNSALKLSMHETYPKLVYPFEWSTKKDISKWFDTDEYYNKYVSHYINKIKKLTFSCEVPVDGKSCGTCESCKRHQNELGK